MVKLRYFILIIFVSILFSDLSAQSGISAKLAENATRYPNGVESFYKYLSDNIKYPHLLIKIEMEGEVDIKFDVNENGIIENIEILRGFDPLADDEVTRVLKTMPKWNNGQKETFHLSVSFTLNDHLRELLNQPEKENTNKEPLVEKEKSENTPSLNSAGIVEAKQDTLLNKAPQFPGGKEAMETYFKKNMKYPKRALELGIEGRVLFNVTIQPDGDISNIMLYKGIFSECNEEAFYLIKKMPKWIPGLKDGNPAPMQVFIPVPFERP
ncbi:MAG: energy transducer TonB [Dysgonomonas sp.]|nr:energy transducer TonB [Dysgonomonas sp.]